MNPMNRKSKIFHLTSLDLISRLQVYAALAIGAIGTGELRTL